MPLESSQGRPEQAQVPGDRELGARRPVNGPYGGVRLTHLSGTRFFREPKRPSLTETRGPPFGDAPPLRCYSGVEPFFAQTSPRSSAVS